MSKHREAFEAFAEQAKEELGEDLKKLVLYGSVVRGEETPESDVDVFAVVETEAELKWLRDLAFEVGVMKFDVFISVQGEVASRFQQRREHPFIRHVLGEGEAYA